MRLVLALLVICACGRLNFESPIDAASEVLAITAPLEGAEVEATAPLTGTCRTGVPVELRGTGLVDGSVVPCLAGAFATVIALSEGDGAKAFTATQDAASASRTVQRVTPARVRSTGVGSRGSAGLMVDCDLVLPVPAELAANDLLFGMIYADNGPLGGAIATPGFQRTGLVDFSHVAFWKIAGAAEPGTYTFRITAGTGPNDTCESAGVLVAFANVTSGLLAESAITDGDGTVTATGVTAPKRGILVGAWGSNGPATGFTQTGMQLAAAVASPGDFANVLVAYEGVQAGETGSRTATIQVARPAAAGLFVLDGKP